ncbi:MAG TPA: hypothetical protein VMA95_11850 [Streptosporangiaceae bacterium]|nr:hypothetical protein [Streptosporangiaceae bacterium]
MQPLRLSPVALRASLRASSARRLSVGVLLAAGLVLAGCSSSGTTSSTPPTSGSTSSSSSAPSGEPTAGASATSAIEANWAKFFSAKTPVDQRVALLQNGSQFESIIQSQEGSPLASQASAKVTHVTLTGTSQASVSYDILLKGKTALGGQTGEAVYQDGVWKVGDTSFCGLLTLEGTKLPSGCKG